MTIVYRTKTVGDVEVFYREAGPTNAPVIVLLHGFPAAGHMCRMRRSISLIRGTSPSKPTRWKSRN